MGRAKGPDPGTNTGQDSGETKPAQHKSAAGESLSAVTVPQSRERHRAITETSLFRPAGPVQRLGLRLQLGLAGAGDWLSGQFAQEREASTAFNFAPVALGLGIAAYFAAPAEPVFWLPPATAALAVIFAWRRPVHDTVYFVLVAAALFLAGMGVAQWRTHMAAAPVIAGQLKAEVTGLVLHVDQNSRGKPRYTLRPVSVEGMEASELPRRIRLSAASAHGPVKPGGTISGLAQLQGFSGPAFPGGYDFSFFNWLDGLGGTGFFLGPPRAVTGPARVDPAGIGEHMAVGISRLRAAIASRLRTGLPGEHGDIAAALITGDRTGLDEATQETLRRSGLAHILAISGLHMALVALTVMGTVRFLLALSPKLALSYPVRKWAAAAGFAAATIYLLISGAGVATQRAWVMIAIMLAAAMLDRRALTMRNVAIAALIVLAIAPESLLHPGFQMSFAAVAALIAAYEAWYCWRRQRISKGKGRWLRRPSLLMQLPAYVIGIAFTSLVAGVATGLFAAYHFHRVAMLGLIANLAAMPIVSLLVIPLALISMLLMPYGFEQWTLGAFGFAVSKVLAVSDWVNSFGVSGNTGLMPLSVLVAATAGLVLLALLRSRLRFAGLLCFAVMAALWHGPRTPDLIVSQDGRAIGAMNARGDLELFYPRRNRFISNIWLRAWPSSAVLADGAPDETANLIELCSRDHCVANLPAGKRVEVVYDPKLLAQACRTADILLAPRLRWVNCRDDRQPELVIKRTDLERRGTHAIYLPIDQPAGSRAERGIGSNGTGATESGYDIRTTLNGSHRPWNMVRLDALAADDARWQARFPRRPEKQRPEGER